MEEQSGNLADETTDLMPETMAHQSEELRKRRSTRIMQAVPLTVSGVDALGRPFTERTSTLIINCHGCRYQSKHYVLKNMWVTLEVPHPEAGQPPRNVRGRVAWIQRPRTVRQLFQVALELEAPGNNWGIAFPPPDWFAPQAALPVETRDIVHEEPQKTAEPTEIHLPLTPSETPVPPSQDNLRIFPAPSSPTDASLQLARHVSRLLADAKQQIQTTAREAAAQAVSAERRVSAEEWEQKAAAAREQLAQQVASSIQKIQEEVEAHSRATHSAVGEALQQDLPRWISPQLEQLTRDLTRQISERGVAERAQTAEHSAKLEESLRGLTQQANVAAEALNNHISRGEARVSTRAGEAILGLEQVARQREVAADAHTEALNATANQIQQQVAAAVSAAQSDWQNRLRTETDAAQERWQATLRDAVASAHEKAAAILGEHARTLVSQFQEESARQAVAACESIATSVTESEQRIGALNEDVRNLISEVQEEARRQSAAARESVGGAASDAEQRVRGLHSQVEAWVAQIHEEGARQSAAARESINGSATQAEHRLTELQQSLGGAISQLQEEASRQTVSSREAISAAVLEAEQRASALRDVTEAHSERLESALTRAAESSDQLGQMSGRMETAKDQALAGFESQVGDVLNIHRNELHRRSESLLEEINARVRSTFEEACQLAVSRFDQQVESMVQPHISLTEEAIHRLAGGRSLLDAALTLQQDRIRTAADEAFAESLASFRENLGGVDKLLQDAAESVAARNLAGIESRVADLKHHTVDDLMKSAEWYEKKAQTQIQNLTEKSVEQAANQLREKAGEVSGVFASQLDHSSRSFLGHTQTQMDEVVRDAFEQARALFNEASETTAAAFTDEIQRHARQELDGFGEETRRSLLESRLQLDTARSELAQKVTAEHESFLHEFRTKMGDAVNATVADANARVQSGISPLLEAWNNTVAAHRNEMRSVFEELSAQAAERHRNRLENVSNQWMLATVASLDHQSREAIASIAAHAEEKLRESCAQVFAGVGETLRERLQQVATNLAFPNPPAPLTRSTTAGGGSGT